MCFFVIFSLLGMVSNPQASQCPEEVDTFATYAYTFGDIVVFSYGDSNYCEILDDLGNSVWSGMLMRDEYKLQKDLTAGVYEIIGYKEFSVLTGDPFSTGIGTWYAVDQTSSPLSTKLLSVGPHVQGSPGNVPVLVVFAYHNNTHVVVTNLDNDQIIWEGDLDSAEYYLREGGNVPPIVYSVGATRPVSTMTGGGLGGMYIPAFNGTFTGRDFMTYQQRWKTDGKHDLQVVPWYDETWVTITDLDDSSDTLWHEFFEKRGEIKGVALPIPGNGRALYIHSDKHISLPQNPWISFGPSSLGFFLMRGIDRDGLGLGKEFYLPVETSLPGYPSRLHVIAFSDNTDIKVTRIPRDGGVETDIYEGTLDRAEYYRYTCPDGDTSAHAIYHVTASSGVATIASCRDHEGSDFLPVWFAIHPAVVAYPSPQYRETYPGVPVSETDHGCYEVYAENNGNIWDVINIFTSHSDPVNFTSELTDEYGGTLPDADGDGNPDTDTLPRRGSVLVLVDVIPSDTVPIGTIDTCYFRVVSSRDTTKCDTALLITRIRSGSVSEEPAAARLPELNFAFGQNVLYVRNPSKEELQLAFFDVLGRRVHSEVLSGSKAEVDVSSFPQGVYFVSVRTGGSRRVIRRVIIY
ncbi:T9SS type A sorting domain-containing protein [candidate division WOR-3 bacterium]|nr:T9SS type A sorting domain-containing protein [candidate division WOR-3 bacterium]